MHKPICLITGVGPGTGTALVKRYLAGGYKVAMLARNADRLRQLSQQLPDSFAFPCDVSDEAQLQQTIAKVRADLGTPNALVHNAVRGTFGNFLEIDAQELRNNFEINTMALFNLSKALAPSMIAAGKGSIMVTGNTSATRGKDFFAGMAPTKAAQRILAESMARAVGPKGVHVAYILIDAVIDVPWTRQRYHDKPDDFFIQPDDIAEVTYQTAHQPKSAWSFNVEVRPPGEVW